MSEPYPISCISCRRKKIKCNKQKPCNQCLKRKVICEFPSTFRNIEINTNDEAKTNDDGPLVDDVNIYKLEQEKDEILNKNIQLTEQNKQLLNKLNQYNIQANYFEQKSDISHEPQAFKISGETSELGKKFYGPQSSSFMLETLKNSQPLDSNQYPKNFLDKDNNTKIEKSLIKKDLPRVLYHNYNFEDNYRIIHTLVEKFFSNYSSNFYKTFISKIDILKFLNNYENIEDIHWENDDELLLLLMILIISIERLTPIEFIEIFNIKESEYSDYKNNLIQNNLTYSFEKLRHNLIFESILTIQSYILCTEWYFIEQRYEECWSMMFHTCSIAYSIGLHVTNKLRLNEINMNDADDELKDIAKLKVWFSLRILSDKVCSILGRPNPISIQVNSILLKNSQGYSKINLSQNKTSILLKIGLSQCIRLSNMMLIENFMIDFTINDLLNLNSKFEEEINLLELYLHEVEINESIEESPASTSSLRNNVGESAEEADSSKELSYDELNYLPVKIEQMNLLNDLIIFYVNKAKLFEPFIIKFSNIEKDSILILDNLSNSILNFLKLTYKFVNKFEIKLSKYGLRQLKLGKYFRINFPFLNSFIYQGIIIIFTLLNYKFKDFVNLKYTPKFDNNKFLIDLKQQLCNMLSVDKNFNEKIWSINVTYLANKNIEIIDVILDNQKKNLELDFENPLMNNQLFNSTNDILNFNWNDPFWITHPDNLPYYLSSPNEESRKQTEEEMEQSLSNLFKRAKDKNDDSDLSSQLEQPKPSKNEMFNLNNQYDDLWDDLNKSKKIKLEDILPEDQDFGFREP